jgi:hypothetical protein
VEERAAVPSHETGIPPAPGIATAGLPAGPGRQATDLALPTENGGTEISNLRPITLFLCGDVMTGKGTTRYSSSFQPRIYEPYVGRH